MSPAKAKRPAARAAGFQGWPKPALSFFQGLRQDNSKAYFERNRQVYQAAVRQPTEDFFAALQRELGPGWEVKIFRINRDLRFSKDKRPYQEHASGYLAAANRASGLYVQVSEEGMYLAAGAHEMDPGQLQRYRDAVAGKEGEKLAKVLATLERDGYAITEPRLKRVPSGYPSDHPRADLLRRTGMMASRTWKPGPWLHSSEALDRARGAWREAKALTSWLEARVGPSSTPMGRG
jgi:uncharacterized protein (TIGR02453 family)